MGTTNKTEKLKAYLASAKSNVSPEIVKLWKSKESSK